MSSSLGLLTAGMQMSPKLPIAAPIAHPPIGCLGCLGAIGRGGLRGSSLGSESASRTCACRNRTGLRIQQAGAGWANGFEQREVRVVVRFKDEGASITCKRRCS